jgi:hypothetical protein
VLDLNHPPEFLCNCVNASFIPLLSAAFGPLPVALPSMPAPPSTNKKQKPIRKVRPALRPSGGSGVGALVAAANVAAPAAGSPTMLALLEGLEKELHSPEPITCPIRGAQPLASPSMAAEGAHQIAVSPALAEGGGGSSPPSGPPVAPSHGSTEALPAGIADDSSENENGGSNEAGEGNIPEGPPLSAVGGHGGDGSAGGSALVKSTKGEPDFTFDPVKKRQTAAAGGSAVEVKEAGSPSLPAKRTRKNVSSEPTSGS